MAVSVTMPQLGESVTEGTVTRWLKAEGDDVQADEPLLEVSTDKVDTEIPAPASGKLLRIVAAEDAVVPVGGELAVIGSDSDAAGSDGPAASAPPAAAAPEEAPSAPPAQADDDVVRSTVDAPSAERVARDEAPGGGVLSGAATPVLLPALGESVTEGTVTRWLKQVGDTVAADEPLVEVSTDKVDTEIPSPAAGVLLAINVAEDETVAVGTELALIGSSGSSAPAPAAAPAAPAAAAPTPPPAAAPAPPAAPAPTPPAPTAPPAPAPAPAASSSEGNDAYVTPLVRKLAAEHGVDLGALTGTGVGGRIRKQDVLDAAAAAKAATAAPAAPQAAAPAARRCGDAPRRCPASARSSPPGWSSRCRSPLS
jgi:2-oxoglutarate dehydrogenase E2 component (dihydrolipoamide succinyltransferase)